MVISQRWTQKPPLGVCINPAHPLSKGLMAYLLFNEGSGDIVHDLSGNNVYGILTSMAFPPSVTSGWNPGRNGPALMFDGIDDYIRVPLLHPAIIGPLTFSMWVFWQGDVTRDVIMNQTIGTADYFWLNISSNGNNKFNIYSDYINPPGYHDSNAVVPSNIWTHLVAIFDVGSVKHYINGVLDKSTPVTGGGRTAAGAFNIGRRLRLQDPPFWFDGIIDNVCIYSRALSAQEVQELYVNPYGMFEWPLMWSVGAPPPPTRIPRPPAVSGVPSAHF